MAEMNLDDRRREQRIRELAYRLWEEDGAPHGRDAEYWERARELIAIEDSAGAGLLPNPIRHPAMKTGEPEGVDEAEIQANYGEFPGLTDQGDTEPAPEPRRSARRRAKQKGSDR